MPWVFPAQFTKAFHSSLHSTYNHTVSGRGNPGPSRDLTSDELDALVENNVHKRIKSFEYPSHFSAALKLDSHSLVEILLKIQY